MKNWKRGIFLWLFAAIFFSWTMAAAANELTKEDLEAFLDGLIPLQIGQANIAGVVVAVVKDGELFFAKGYGYADAANKVPITPKATLFRIGSVSKLFTWTAVMQQVELGKLDLDHDINEYLDFKIPPAFGKPITMRDLMTHRPGFEDIYKTTWVSSIEELMPLSHYLKTYMPARIFPPGLIPAYSNYGATLAAYIVERVSGKNFDDYVEEHIFKPLEMDHSTFRQPLPENLKPLMSKGYKLASKASQPFEVVEVAPAGSLSSSVTDIANFMIMQLQNGRYKEKQILKPETALQMHTRQNGWPREMNAMCLGFYEQSQNGWRVIGHAGDTVLFHSNLSLILDANVGIFLSYNSGGKATPESELRFLLLKEFMDRYFPDSSPQKPAIVTSASQDAHSVVGSYKSSRRNTSNFMALLSLVGQSKVWINPEDNTISMTDYNGLNGQPLHFRQIGPMLFREVGGKTKLAFVDDSSLGRLIYFDTPFIASQEVNNFFDKKMVNYFILGFSLLVILLTLLTRPIAAMIREHYDQRLLLDKQGKWLRILVYVVCLIIVVYIVATMIFLNLINERILSIGQQNLWLPLLKGLGVFVGLGALIAIYQSIYSWRKNQEWFWSKIWNTLLALACLGFFWFLYHWNFLNFSLNF